ncbi:YebC/PmpR family DNA-binding transcriptional regulator [Aestuariibacter halophilus]|uniref:Probable transcriptional regulatory protein LJ739_07645 n=1 Tax=Fluctibacter halophilus TaxID=226011 RepID=A0ABS8G6F9_9ALTE|nr:YebC/PmpR family DNA-binding transcriptional regulator [Aestuariibacter halophilus]MCC2616108.1 YebC/PmpR family DNA-binding transcriptional regulator [Aestuariibacter halophilus]
MAGHSKWANIKHRKAAQDAKRGKVFTKLIRELVVAAREGGEDVSTNPRLRAAVDKALSNNMKRDTIDNAIARGAGNLDGDNMETVVYEGYGPGGTAVMVETMTDNRNRTVSAVRHAFNKHGGNLGTDGSVSYLFDKRGVIQMAPEVSEEDVMEVALEAGAEDVRLDSEGVQVLTTPADFGAVKDALDSAGADCVHAQVTMVPSTKASLNADEAATLLTLVDVLEDIDDVQEVYSNADISDDVLAQLEQ